MIVIDTCLLFSNFAEDDADHEVANSIFSKILYGNYGQPIIIDYVYNELMTLSYDRTKDFDLCSKIENFLDKYIKKNIFGFVHTPNDISQPRFSKSKTLLILYRCYHWRDGRMVECLVYWYI